MVDLSFANWVDDDYQDMILDLRGNDIYDIAIRDGDCNLIFYATTWVMLGTSDETYFIPGQIIPPNLSAPVSGPFTVSFHETDNLSTALTSYQNTPPIATYILDHTTTPGDCGTLPDVGTPNCPFVTTQPTIPTLSQWGLINLGLIVLIFGVVAVGNRSALYSKC